MRQGRTSSTMERYGLVRLHKDACDVVRLDVPYRAVQLAISLAHG
jgi:predicted transcriptional regulator